jgi:phosphoribosylformylglycinamidine synthase
VLRIPIGHGEGNYYAPPDALQEIETNRQVVFRYCAPDGRIGDEANPNGSVNGIAGLCNEARNVVGMMPHPERACERALGSEDGLVIMSSIIEAVSRGEFSESGGFAVQGVERSREVAPSRRFHD